MTTVAQIHLIVGLGNPGEKYALTRHNAGAWVVAKIANIYGVDLRLEPKFHGLVGEVLISDNNIDGNHSASQRFCKLLIPTTFMNCSGRAVQALTNFYKIAPANILVVHDELDFPCGVVRFKFDGGHNSHNGLKDVIVALGGGQFHRVRIGIGRPIDKTQNVSDYVLGRPSKTEKEQIDIAIDEAIPRILKL